MIVFAVQKFGNGLLSLYILRQYPGSGNIGTLSTE
jgi:hypothetical protein